MSGEPHRSIGEVLNLLQEDFPDVTISKIRFLESQGLIDPDRTDSGYRKFGDDDIALLRWILHQQRDHFLPLKVIKERLQEDDVDLEWSAHDPVADPVDAPGGSVGDDQEAEPGRTEVEPSDSNDTSTSNTAAVVQLQADFEVASVLDTGPSGISLSREELAGSTGLSVREISDLERFGLLAPRLLGEHEYFDEDALVVARLAAGFREYGVEARHLRMYKIAAEREAGFFEQVLMPYLKRREPKARSEALERLDHLVELGDGLRDAMLRHVLRDHLSGG